jgi:pilus assembly protein CpaF
MKLSEKLAALEEEEKASGEAAAALAPSAVKRKAVVSTRARSAGSWEATKRKVRELVLEEVAPRMQGLSGDELTNEVKAALDRILQREDVVVSPLERRKFVQEMISDTLGYGPLDPLLQDNSITEIMCNGYDDIWIERAGLIEQTDLAFADDSQYRQVIDKIVSAVGRRVDESSPMVDARLQDGSRVNVIVPPLALDGPVMSIRRFRTDKLAAADLVIRQTLTQPMLDFLKAAVAARLNVIVSGGTGAGKTTMLNVLSSFISPRERLVTIEDAAELMLRQPHVVRLETRPPNIEGKGGVRQRQLVINALRMRPDRIIVGEVRGEEALDMLQAMNTGHDGSLTTIHANSPRDALYRLDTMVAMANLNVPDRAVRQQIASAVNLVVQVNRMTDGTRKVTSISEITGMEGETITMQEIFAFQQSAIDAEGKVMGRFRATGIRPKCADKLTTAGSVLPIDMFEHEEVIGQMPNTRRTW